MEKEGEKFKAKKQNGQKTVTLFTYQSMAGNGVLDM